MELDDAELVPALEASIADAKRLVARCLEVDVPAVLGRDEACCGSGKCSPKVQVLVRPEDVPRLAELLHRDWLDSMQREGTLDEELLEKLRAASADPEADPPCPACGTSAPLVEGACSDCGLQLE